MRATKTKKRNQYARNEQKLKKNTHKMHTNTLTYTGYEMKWQIFIFKLLFLAIENEKKRKENALVFQIMNIIIGETIETGNNVDC